MSLLNSILRSLFDGLLYPARNWPPLVSLAILSLGVGIVMLLVFKVTSNQTKLADVKRHIHAGLFEIRLFNDNLPLIFRAQGEILRHNLTYLRLSLVPMLWIMVPLFLVIAQLQFHYGYRGLGPDEPVLVKVELQDGAVASRGGARPDIALEAPAGIRVETPAVWIPELNEVSWRIAAEDAGDYELTVRLGQETFTKSVVVSEAVVRRAPERVASVWWKELVFPAEAPLPDGSPILSVKLDYPDREISVLGFGLHWIVVFFVLSIVFAFALRNRLGVTI